MPRAVSPAFSETEVDISKHLFNQDIDDSEEDFLAEASSHARPAPSAKGTTSDPLELIGQGDDEDDDDAFIAATQAAANRRSDNKVSKKAGAFQTMGLNTHLLKAITRKGFTVPTPIQRKTIPLVLDGQDVVGMARTGSGKTAAFVIPMVERLKAHSAKVGARAIVLSPSRELALQTLKVIKEMSKGTDLRTILLVGGDSLEEQFSSMASNPDIIVATPGRFEHLKVEMALELSSVKYVVFDEADRLFEMGFAAQLAEIMHSLPTERQTLLFSATLPKSLVEFARAGLHDPKLVRLDAETKIAPGLQSAFFSVKRAEKEGALLHILEDVIKMPIGSSKVEQAATQNKKRKRGQDIPANSQPSPYSTVLFAATKHHVDYLASLLKSFGYAVSYVYGSLDQTARKMQVQDFRSGVTNILVVTDVAARGLDIPVLANVINYDFPSQPKIYVHRVGRTARAGKEGWSYSLITQQDMPYLLDLQLFLGRKLIVGRGDKEGNIFKNAIVLGSLRQNNLESNIEESTRMIDKDSDLAAMRVVAEKGEKQYLRTRNAASTESVKRAKQLSLSQELKGVNLLFEDEGIDLEAARLDMLARVSGFRPQETVFEVGKRGKADEAAEFMRSRRAKVKPKFQSHDNDNEEVDLQEPGDASATVVVSEDDSDDELVLTRPNADMAEASDDELELTFVRPNDQKKGKRGWQDDEHFMSYTPAGINVAEDRGYGVHSGSNSNFVTEAKGISMDLNNDESKAFGEASKAKGMRWDKKHKKYVARVNDEDGSKGKKYIIGESGQKIAASFRSGRFDAWRKANKVGRLPRVGEMERGNAHYAADNTQGKRYKHKQDKAPKDADKYRDDYYKRKKMVEAAKEARRGRFAEGQGKSELKGADDVRKMRKLQERRKEKNARPSRRR